MSLYNSINGYNPACVLIMPMLGKKKKNIQDLETVL